MGKTVVLGAKDRATNKVLAEAVDCNVDKLLMWEFVRWVAKKEATLYTDESPAYNECGNREAVCHSVGEFVRDSSPHERPGELLGAREARLITARTTR